MTTINLKNIGLIASYAWLIVSVYVFDWQPFSVFSTFLSEYLVLVFIYLISEIIRYKSFDNIVENTSIAKYIVLFFFAGIQLFVAFATQEDIRENLSNNAWNYLDYNFFIALFIMILSYILRIKKLAKKGDIHVRIEENMIFNILALSFMNFGALACLAIFGDSSAKLIIVSSLVARIGLEVYISRHVKLI